MGICFEKFSLNGFDHCTNIIECTYKNLGGIGYYTLRLYGTASGFKAVSLCDMLPY